MVFENRNEDAVELFDGFGGAVEGVHQASLRPRMSGWV